jgi:hypothetical protein
MFGETARKAGGGGERPEQMLAQCMGVLLDGRKRSMKSLNQGTVQPKFEQGAFRMQVKNSRLELMR